MLVVQNFVFSKVQHPNFKGFWPVPKYITQHNMFLERRFLKDLGNL